MPTDEEVEALAEELHAQECWQGCSQGVTASWRWLARMRLERAELPSERQQEVPQPTATVVAHEVAKACNNAGGEFESWLRLYLDVVEKHGFKIVRAS